MSPQTASERIVEHVSSWPGIEVGPNARGALAFFVGRREIGHLHGDHALHTNFPKPLWEDLKAQGRIAEHPVFPGRIGPAARRIASEEDVRDVIALLRFNYDRIPARDGVPVEAA
jgi:hypothetical protein